MDKSNRIDSASQISGSNSASRSSLIPLARDVIEPSSNRGQKSSTRSTLVDEFRKMSNVTHEVRFARPFAAEMKLLPNVNVDSKQSSLGILELNSKSNMTQIVARASMLDQALQFTNANGYNSLNHLKGNILVQLDRNLERAIIQRDANLALQREDCREANFADYVHYDPVELGDTEEPSIPGNHDGGTTRIDVNNPSQRMRTMTANKRGVVEELVSQGASPTDVAKLSDIFEHPSCLKEIDMGLIPWIKQQTEIGYWRNEAALFVLCTTMAISVGHVETMFKLNTAWSGMAFLVPYFFAYILVVQPMISLELMLGQLFRCGQSAMYDKLRRGSSGLGTVIVIICLTSGCIACARSAAEYMLYIADLFKQVLPWKLTPEEQSTCVGAMSREVCEKMAPICWFNGNNCIPNTIGKAYVAYQSKFYPLKDVGGASIEPSMLWAMFAIYAIVTLFQLAGMGNFTFTASLVIMVAFFVTHVQAFLTLSLDGGKDFLWSSVKSWHWSNLYQSSRIWSHTLRSCMYEFIVGSGIYSTLSTKSRIGYDVSKETVGVGIFSGYVTMLVFGAACGLIGHHAKVLNVQPKDLMWMLEQDCSYILLPLGFQITHNIERTLGMLQFGCCVVLLCSTLAIQIEVAVANLKDLPFMGINLMNVNWIRLMVIFVLLLLSLSFSTRVGKDVVWFLETAVGDLGRSFTVFITSIVVGWLHGCDKQKEVLGKATVYTFNSIFWAFNCIAFICETCDESLPALVWWSARVLGIIIATFVALHVNKKDEEHSKSYKDVLWWLFCGNVEQLRREFCRVSPISNAAGLPMRLFWSICIKWFIPCMMSNTIADILEELIAPGRLTKNSTFIPNGWPFVTILLWMLMIALVFTPPLLLWIAPRMVPVYNTINLEDLPSSPTKHSFWVNFKPRNLFSEFLKQKKQE
ncbi:uncharacterized protein BBOV_IV002780 [Babesia bovis T2Bo]|uniref:Hypothetcial protein n=1 Tax=Babesia bovis TaxID=5865 RepID=A7AVP9_BABBO|nr:uncharacterized protein BBOV_IV002780 [Babesia bovis T2Bo]EDO05875.1 hypothetical protein BBOV_IV002780 [Babesia bovis T2Bo]|eukprot:XP_001609443.1 hypothetical protein [Babesia bovis T2Bo]